VDFLYVDRSRKKLALLAMKQSMLAYDRQRVVWMQVYYLFIKSRFSGPFIPKGNVDPPYMTALTEKEIDSDPRPSPQQMESSALGVRCAQSSEYEPPCVDASSGVVENKCWR